MIPGIALRWHLSTLQGGGNATLTALRSMLRPPHYEHEVRYPIERAWAEDDWVGPSKEATQWLRESRLHGEIGPWDSTVCNDRYMPLMKLSALKFDEPVPDTMVVDDRFYIVVSFLDEADSILFKLRWL